MKAARLLVSLYNKYQTSKMKKIVTLAMAVFLSATFATTAYAKKEKKQKKAQVEQKAPMQLTSTSDSLSYASGVMMTNGLIDYAKRQFNLDSVSLQAFVDGLREGLEQKHDIQFLARVAGLQIAQQVENNIFPNVCRDVKDTQYAIDSLTFIRGFVDGVANDTLTMTMHSAQNYYRSTLTIEKERLAEIYKQENADWLKKNATAEGVHTTASGLQYKVITEGKGRVATENDNVTVRYEGKTIDGKVFDSSYVRDPDTSTFRPNQVIKGWTEALTMMPEGSKWELYIPQELAYGERTAGNIKPNSTLIFTVEVVKVEPEQEEVKAEAKPATTKPAKNVGKTSKKRK